MPNILAIETSFPAASISLQLDSHQPVNASFESHRQQNQLLFPPLQALLDSLPAEQTLDAILIGTGPGSYSGTRIAIAAAQGIAAVHSCPVIGIASYFGIHSTLPQHDYLAVGDARRDSFFISKIAQGTLPEPPTLYSREEFDAQLCQANCDIVTFDTNMTFPDGSPIPQVASYAENLIHAWNQFSSDLQQRHLETPPSPIYLRAPFITKAKPGHPLLRGKPGAR